MEPSDKMSALKLAALGQKKVKEDEVRPLTPPPSLTSSLAVRLCQQASADI